MMIGSSFEEIENSNDQIRDSEIPNVMEMKGSIFSSKLLQQDVISSDDAKQNLKLSA